MRNISCFLLVAICLGFVTKMDAQHKRYAIQNGFGIQGGLTQFDIITDNFTTKANTGWIGGLSAYVDIPHKWYNVSYVIQLSENSLDVGASPSGLSESEFVEYKMLTAQMGLLMHAKLANRYLTLDFGPMLQYNGELEQKDKTKGNYIINGYNNLLVGDLTEISQFNVDGVVGITAGFDNLRLRAHYIYGFTNILNKLNDQQLDVDGNSSGKFKGNQSMLAFSVFFLF